MSQIKSNKVTGRTPTGTLTIGEPGSTVQFDPDATVLLNDYATKEYVDERTPNLGDADFDNYYNKQEIDAIVDEAGNEHLKLTGGRMSGSIAMEEGTTITMNVGDPDPGVEIHDTFISGLTADITRADQAATKSYVDDQVATGGGSVDMTVYQELDEKDKPGGYAGLNADGKVPADKLDTVAIEDSITDLADQTQDNTASIIKNTANIASHSISIAKNANDIATNAAKIDQLESSTFQLMYTLEGKAGEEPNEGFMTINADDWANTTHVRLNHTDINGVVNDFHSVHVGDSIWFADTTHDDDPSLQSADTMGAYTVSMIDHPEGALVIDFTVIAESTRGAPQIGDAIAASIYPSVDVSSKADISYVDSQDDYIKDNYLPLDGGDMRGDIYMKSKKIIGLPRDTVGNQAISVQGAQDRFMPIDAGDFDNYLSLGGGTMRGNINMDNHILSNAGGIRTTSDGAVKSRFVDSGQNSNLNIQRNGETKIQVGGTSVIMQVPVTLNQPGTDPKHAVRMDQLPEVPDPFDPSAPMESDLNMGGHRVTNIDTDPNYLTDALSVGAGNNAYLKLNGNNEMEADLNVGGNRITNLASPFGNSDAVTKFYVDNNIPEPAISPLAWKYQAWGGSGEPYPGYFKRIYIVNVPHLMFHYEPEIGPEIYSPNVLQGDGDISMGGVPTTAYDKVTGGGFRPAYMANGLFFQHSPSYHMIVVQVEEKIDRPNAFSDERVYYWKLPGVF